MNNLRSSLLLFFLLIFSSFIYSQTQVQSGTFSADLNTSGYSLHKNSGDRTYTLEINFEKPFEKKPKVVISVCQIDVDTKTNMRYKLEATSISRDGFTLKISTWSESRIFGISGSWIAHAD